MMVKMKDKLKYTSTIENVADYSYDERKKLEAENDRLREALELIERHSSSGYIRDIAKQALMQSPDVQGGEND